MKNLTLENIANACNGTYIGDENLKQTEVMGVVTDSRQVEKDYLYVAMVGERVDGHTFIPGTFEKGAAAAISEQTLENPAGPYILVESSAIALKRIAEFYRKQLGIKIVGIAGSVGKTSTKEMIASVLSEKFNVLKTDGNFNNEIGLPLTILRIRDEHEVAVVEMGISDFGEMHRLAEIARPDICVMTNIGQCHLENLIDRDGILRAKSEIFDFLQGDGAIVLNGNDDKLSLIEEKNGVKPVRYFVNDGTAQKMNDYYMAEAIDIVNNGLEGMEANMMLTASNTACSNIDDSNAQGITCSNNNSEGLIDEVLLHIAEPIPGIHNIYNACAAACVGRILGLSDDEIVAGISHAKTIAGRTNLIKANDMIIIDDCYNANPVSMKAAIDVLQIAKGRKVAILGDMGELGENEKALHRGVGEYFEGKGIDLLIAVGELAKEIADGAEGKVSDILRFESLDQLLEKLAIGEVVKADDNVLVKASHFMNFPKIVKALVG